MTTGPRAAHRRAWSRSPRPPAGSLAATPWCRRHNSCGFTRRLGDASVSVPGTPSFGLSRRGRRFHSRASRFAQRAEGFRLRSIVPIPQEAPARHVLCLKSLSFHTRGHRERWRRWSCDRSEGSEL